MKAKVRKLEIEVSKLEDKDLPAAVNIWNEVVEDGVAFPQMEPLTLETGENFFGEQSYVGVARFVLEKTDPVEADGDRGNAMPGAGKGEIVGLYILHPNNVGRCGHICNASYAVRKDMRGRQIGEALVKDCMKKAGELGFRILQFNAVVKSNEPALALYKKLGFTQLGVIPNGFLLKDGSYEDIIPHYIDITSILGLTTLC